jgi:peptidoglycan/xylan/chitin deacetylase (PgdA/CDA1 family)
MNRHCAVLGYHKIGPPSVPEWDTWFYIPTEIFSEQLHAVRRLGWEFISAQTFLDGLRDPATLPEKSCLVTFDDAYTSTLEIAAPVMKDIGCPSVVFVPALLVGGTNVFDKDIEPTETLCSWEQLRRLSQFSCSAQSHGLKHQKLSSLPPGARREEIIRSREIIEANLGTPVNMYSFTYGDNAGAAPEVTSALEAAGYGAAFLYGGGSFNPARVDPMAIPRLAMGPDTDPAAALAPAV